MYLAKTLLLKTKKKIYKKNSGPVSLHQNLFLVISMLVYMHFIIIGKGNK